MVESCDICKETYCLCCSNCRLIATECICCEECGELPSNCGCCEVCRRAYCECCRSCGQIEDNCECCLDCGEMWCECDDELVHDIDGYYEDSSAATRDYGNMCTICFKYANKCICEGDE